MTMSTNLTHSGGVQWSILSGPVARPLLRSEFAVTEINRFGLCRLSWIHRDLGAPQIWVWISSPTSAVTGSNSRVAFDLLSFENTEQKTFPATREFCQSDASPMCYWLGLQARIDTIRRRID